MFEYRKATLVKQDAEVYRGNQIHVLDKQVKLVGKIHICVTHLMSGFFARFPPFSFGSKFCLKVFIVLFSALLLRLKFSFKTFNFSFKTFNLSFKAFNLSFKALNIFSERSYQRSYDSFKVNRGVEC